MPNDEKPSNNPTTQLDKDTVKALVRMPMPITPEDLIETILPVLKAEGIKGVARVAAITYMAQRLWIEDLKKQLRTARGSSHE